LQVSFRKRATKYRALLQKMTSKDKASYSSSTFIYTYIHTCKFCTWKDSLPRKRRRARIRYICVYSEYIRVYSKYLAHVVAAHCNTHIYPYIANISRISRAFAIYAYILHINVRLSIYTHIYLQFLRLEELLISQAETCEILAEYTYIYT